MDIQNMNMESFDGIQFAEEPKNYLSFLSDGLSYAVLADSITEILTNTSVTHLPTVPHDIKGVLNLRGQIIPVIDFRIKTGRMPQTSSENCIIIIELDSVTLIGLLVDEVSHVVRITDREIAPPPSSGLGIGVVSGIVNVSGEAYRILDITAFE